MKTIPAGQFKARCLRLMDEVRSTREPVLITKKGRPFATARAEGLALVTRDEGMRKSPLLKTIW